MTNEEIFITFLKTHRKFASAKRQFSPPEEEEIQEPYQIKEAVNFSMIWEGSEEGFRYWVDMQIKWHNMCEDLNITGTISLSKVFK